VDPLSLLTTVLWICFSYTVHTTVSWIGFPFIWYRTGTSVFWICFPYIRYHTIGGICFPCRPMLWIRFPYTLQCCGSVVPTHRHHNVVDPLSLETTVLWIRLFLRPIRIQDVSFLKCSLIKKNTKIMTMVKSVPMIAICCYIILIF